MGTAFVHNLYKQGTGKRRRLAARTLRDFERDVRTGALQKRPTRCEDWDRSQAKTKRETARETKNTHAASIPHITQK